MGVYRSDDRGDTWERLDRNGLPSEFGFGLALDPVDPDVAYVVPEVGAENRVTPDGRLGVYRTGDGGASWELTADGLPDPAWAAVLVEGMGWDDGGVYFGTQSGAVFALATSDGGSWVEAALAAAADPLGRSGDVAVIRLPSLLAEQAGGRKEFETDAGTLGEALRALPVADLPRRARRPAAAREPVRRRPRAREQAGLETPLEAGSAVRVVQAVAGG